MLNVLVNMLSRNLQFVLYNYFKHHVGAFSLDSSHIHINPYPANTESD